MAVDGGRKLPTSTPRPQTIRAEGAWQNIVCYRKVHQSHGGASRRAENIPGRDFLSRHDGGIRPRTVLFTWFCRDGRSHPEPGGEGQRKRQMSAVDLRLYLTPACLIISTSSVRASGAVKDALLTRKQHLRLRNAADGIVSALKCYN